MTTVYKVVRRRWDGKLASAYIKRGKALTLYAANEPSFAKNGMKLLAFDRHANAARFAWEQDAHEIWLAEAENVTPQTALEFLYMTWKSFKAFWEGSTHGTQAACIGTVACDSITLIKRVDKERRDD